MHTALTQKSIDLYDRYVMKTYPKADILFTRGSGCRLWDGDGREYLDFAAGIAVCSLGHCHPAVTRAIAERLRPEGLRAELSLVFQSCEDLAHCCPEHRGDWYFTGDYPTPGGFRVVNRALVNYVENRDERAY